MPLTNEESQRLDQLKTEEQQLINRMTEINATENPWKFADEFEQKRSKAENLQTEIHKLINRQSDSSNEITEEKQRELKTKMNDSLKRLLGVSRDRDENEVRDMIQRIMKEEGYRPDSVDRKDEQNRTIIAPSGYNDPLVMRAGDHAFVKRLKEVGGFFSENGASREDIQRANGFLAFTPADGGNLIPDETAFQERFHEVQKDFGGLEKVSTVWRRKTGRDILLNMLDDTVAGGAGEKAEGIVANNPADVTVGGGGHNIVLTPRTLKANTYTSGKIPYTWEFEDDYPMALLQLARLAGKRTARKYTVDYVNGDGAGRKPRGILTDSAKGADITFDISEGHLLKGHEIIGTICDAIDFAYASMPGGAVVMNQYTLTKLRTIPGTDGHPLYPELQWRSRENQPMIGNMPVQIDNNYPSIPAGAGNAKVITVGDHHEYWILEVTGMRTIIDPISEYGNIFYVLIVRRGGLLVDTKAVTHVLATTQA